MPTARLMEHIWQTISDIKYAEVNGDTGNRAGSPWYDSAHDDCVQNLCGWMDVLTENVDLTPIYCCYDDSDDTHVRFWMFLPADDMTWDEIYEEPGILSEQNGCQKVFIDIYPRFGGYDVIARRNSNQIGRYEDDPDMQEISDRVFDALHDFYELEDETPV